MKTFFVDIDGVIYKNGKINKDVINIINNSKNHLVFCTGRGYVRCLDILADYVKKDTILIIENGSKIVDYKGNVIYSKNLSLKTKKSLEKIDYNQVKYIIYNSNFSKGYIAFPNVTLKHVIKNHNNYSNFYNEMLYQKMTQITIKLKDNIYKDFFVNFLLSKKINVNKSEDYIIINEENINKKRGISEYMKKFKIKFSDIVIIGNDYNDIEMFTINCAYKIAVKDECTPNSLLNLATEITNFKDLSKIVYKIVETDSNSQSNKI